MNISICSIIYISVLSTGNTKTTDVETALLSTGKAKIQMHSGNMQRFWKCTHALCLKYIISMSL